ncbi:hypothetical protein R6Q59_002308 [Mikania micrantha]
MKISNQIPKGICKTDEKITNHICLIPNGLCSKDAGYAYAEERIMEYDSSPAKRRKISHENPESNKDPNLNAIEGSTMDATEETVFKRTYCDEFLKFWFERFSVGVWTSRTRRNIKQVLDFLMRDTQHQLLFCWDEIWLLYRINLHCIGTCFNTIENNEKPLLLNELKKLWEKQDPNLPWDRGVFDESNTLILDDSPYKALLNLHCNFHSGIYEKIVPNFCSLDLLLGGSPTLRVGIIGAFIESSLPTAMPPCKDSSSTDDLNLSMSDQLAQPLATAAATSTTSNQTASQLADLIQPTLRVGEPPRRRLREQKFGTIFSYIPE